MRALVILVAASCCSAHLEHYAAPWVLPSAKLIPSSLIDTEGKAVALPTPYIHSYTSPFLTPYTYPYATAYAYPYGYVVKPDLKATEFPYIWQTSEAAAEIKPEAAPAVEEARRRRRDVEALKVPLPYIQAVPAVAKTTFEAKHFEPVEAATPADTTKLELITKEHEVAVPTVKYVQPVVQYKPVTYKVASPVPLTYSFPSHSYYHTFPAFPYVPPAARVVKLEE